MKYVFAAAFIVLAAFGILACAIEILDYAKTLTH